MLGLLEMDFLSIRPTQNLDDRMSINKLFKLINIKLILTSYMLFTTLYIEYICKLYLLDNLDKKDDKKDEDTDDKNVSKDEFF